MAISFKCSCGKAYKVNDALAGKKAACKECGQTMRIPSAVAPQTVASAATVTAKPARPAAGLDWSNLMKAEATAPASQAQATTAAAAPPRQAAQPSRGAACPGCGAMVAPGTVLCTRCGFNFSTGQRTATEVFAQPAMAAPPRAAGAAKPRSQAAGARDKEDAVANTDHGWALWLMIMGVGAAILPLFGIQFKILMIFGEYSIFMGLPMGIIAAIIYFCRGMHVWGGIAIGAPVMALVIAFVVASNQPDEPEAADPSKPNAASVQPAPSPAPAPSTPTYTPSVTPTPTPPRITPPTYTPPRVTPAPRPTTPRHATPSVP